MSDLPVFLTRPLDRAVRRATIAAGLQIGAFLLSLWYEHQAVYLAGAIAGSFTVLFGVQWLVGLLKLPEKLRKHELEVAKRAVEMRQRELQAERMRHERAKAVELIEQQRIEEFAKASDLQSGERVTLQTRVGPIWVTRCVNGTLRLWWGFNTRVRELAVPIIRSRAHYDGTAPVAWFINRGMERSVLLDLARI